MSGCAWVTLATNDSYSLGALVLAHSLRKSNTVHKLAVLITPAVSQAMRGQLETVYDLVKVVDVLDSKDEAHLALMKRPELGITFTKIHCWRLTEFVKCVFLDADTLVVRNCDELFEREEFSAAPDVSWPDCFNSGVFVYKPSVETFNKLLQFAVEKGSFDGGDQGLLNQFFSDWATEDIKKHLPFVYNLTTVAAYSYVPAFKQYGSETRIVHFIGTGKPWLQQLDPATKKITPTSGSEHLTPLLQQWWDLFCEKVHPNLDKSLEIANGMSHPSVEACSNSIGVECNDEPEPPCLLEPQTAYREKNDFRQINLPYQPFDVKDSSGELLNVKFFTAPVVPSPPPSPSPTTMTNPNEHREEQQREWREWEKEEEKRNSEGDKEEKVIAECGEIGENGNQFQKPDGGGTNDDQHVEKDEREEKGEEKTLEEAPKGPFDYNSFFPDETCIDNYLQQNVATYQPFGSPRHEHNESNHNRSHEENNGDRNESNVDQDNQNIPPSLPRFLTIPEDDQRQRGNEERCFSEEREFKHVEETIVHRPQQQPNDEYKQSFAISTNEIPQRVETFVEKRELHKSKSMSHLAADANTPDASPKGSIWKSQPSVNTDPNKKYSMPKLKPILPRQNSKSVLPSIPKVTLYTEFLMSSEYKVPEDLPKDKVGFVESHLRNSKDSHLKRSKSDADIGKFGPLPYAFTSEVDKTTVPKQKTLFRRLDNDPELYDLTQCKRQQGNKPKPKESKEKKENNGVLPALKPLKPLIPSKDKKSVKKRKSNELSLSPGDEERGKKPKQESRRVKERKKPTKPSSVCSKKTVSRNADSVDDILKRLYDFSKDYQHYFGDIRFKTASGDKTESRTKENENEFETTEAKKKETYKNANVQVPDTSPNTSEREQDSKTFEKVKLVTSTVSEGTQTTKETHSNKALREGGELKDFERSEESKGTRKTNSKAGFKKFRSYLKDQTETTLKGLLDIPKIMSDSNGNDDEPRCRKSNAIVGMSSLDVVKTFGTYKPDEVSTKPGVSENKKEIKPESCPQAMREGANGLESKEGDSKVSSLADTIKKGSPTTKDEVVLFVDERKEQSTSESVATSSRSSAPTSKGLTQPEDDTYEERTDEAKSKPIDTEAKPEQIEGIKQTDGSKDSKEETCTDPKTVNGDNCKREDVRVVRAAPKVVEMSKSQEEGKAGVTNGRSQSNLEKESDKTEKKILKNGKVMTSKFGDDFPDQVDGIEGSSQTSLGNGGGLGSHDPNPKVKENKILEKIKKLETKHSNKPEPLCVPDFDTPRTSRVWLEAPTSTEKHSQVTEIVEEMVTKATTSVVHAEAKPSSSSMHPPKSSLVPRTSKSVTSPSRKSKSSPGQSKNRSPRNPIANGTKSPETKRQNGVSSKFQIFADNSPDETSGLVDKNMAAKNRPPTYPSAKYSLSPANNVDGSDCSNNGQESSATLEDRRWASGIAGAIAQLNIESGGEGTKQQTEAGSAAYQEYLRRQNWETGNMDYMGRDSFDNIWSKICQTLEGKMLESLGGSSEAPSLDNSVPTQTIAPQGIVEQPGKEQALAQIAGSEPTTTTTTTTTTAASAAAAATTPMEVKKDENVTVPEVPEYMETLPGSEMSRGPAEEDEIIFTKPENRQTGLTNIVEEEEASDMSSKITGDAVSQEGLVKLSDILKPGQSPAGEDKKSWALVKRPDADKLQVVEVPKKPEDASETSKSKLSKVASRKEAQKSQDVQKEAIPLPDVPGRDGPEPPKREEEAPVSPVQEAQEAIEALPEEQPTETQSGTESSNGKQKKGVFSKILEMVGVSSKDKKGNEPEVSKSVFYDVEGAAASKGQTSEDLSAPKVPESEKPTPEAKGTTETKQEAPVVAPPAVETAKKEVKPEKTVPVAEIKPQQDEKPQQPSAVQKEEKSDQKPEQKIQGQKPEATSAQPQAPKPETASAQPQEPDTTQKGKGIPKPARNSKPSEKKPEESKPADPAAPSQPTGLSVDPTQKPEIIFTMPTPPVLSDVPTPSGDSASAIVQPTPPEVKGIDAKGKVMTEIDEILGKAKSEVESRLQEVDRKSAEKEEKSNETVEENVKDLINTMKLIVGDDQKVEEPPQSVEDKKSGEVPEPTVPQPPTTTEAKSGGGKQPAKQPQGKKPQKGPQKKKEEIEELKVTTEEERKKHKTQATSSKLSDQILKAIPPPRRKTISESKAESSSSSGAIPKTPLEAAAAAATEAGQSKDIISDKPAEAPPSTSGPEPKSSKPSSIPVPPPRNKPKPGQPTSQQKGKTKK